MGHSKNTITTHFTLSPLARAAALLLAERLGVSATALVSSLLREELGRLLPGAWESLAMTPRTGTPEERTAAVLRALRERLLAQR